MEPPLGTIYRQTLRESYSRAIALISILGVVVAVVIGGYDLLQLIRPDFTLSSALREKYSTNESYTEFGTFKSELSEEQISHERMANYEKLLRMERRNAQQRLVKTGLALLAIAALNGAFFLTVRWSGEG
ncbi:MAG: hypothetical protein HYV03_02495 [Deltaproteobacteria bacterium]|nr:hypothetical protein [Deltaproteobacteria bacterium]